MDVISFARGNPSPDILPVEAFAECAQAVIAREGRTILNYGPAGGYAPLRERLAAEHGVEPSQILISTGSLAPSRRSHTFRLEPGVYRFEVVARNASGTSPPSARSNAVRAR